MMPQMDFVIISNNDIKICVRPLRLYQTAFNNIQEGKGGHIVSFSSVKMKEQKLLLFL